MNYKLGDLVELVTETNSDLKYGLNDIVGVTLEKQMIPTIANLTQTDLDNFIIVHPKDFVYNPRTHGKKIGLGFNTMDRCFISSWNNNTFRVKEKMSDVILPEYLYMYFLRDRWDKEACFNAWGSSTVVLLWSSFCNIEINVPSIVEQRRIVHDYQVITDRIELLRKMNDNLFYVMNTIYYKWFVRYDPFGGVKPDEWLDGKIEDIADFYDYLRRPLSGEEREGMQKLYPYYGAISIVDYVDDYLFDDTYVLLSEDGANILDENGHPALQFIHGKVWVNNHAHVLKAINGFSDASLYVFLSNTQMQSIVTGAAQPKINQENLRSFPVTVPEIKTMTEFNKLVNPLFMKVSQNNDEIDKLKRLSVLFFSQMSKGA